MACFEVRDLSVGQGERPLVEGLSFALDAGERLALVGPSGVGKTTVLRALAWLDDPRAGEVTLDGLVPEAHGVPRWRRRVVLSAQRAAFFGETVGAELARPFGYRVADQPFPEARARALLERFGLSEKWAQRAEALSEGEQQRVALTRALLLRPAVLLLDEPTSALDPDAVGRVEELLDEQCREDGTSLVLVTHLREQRERLGARPIDLTHPEGGRE